MSIPGARRDERDKLDPAPAGGLAKAQQPKRTPSVPGLARAAAAAGDQATTRARYQEPTTMPGAAPVSPAVQEAQKGLKTTNFQGPRGGSMNTRAVRTSSWLLLWPALALAQSPKAATYITDEQVEAVNALPGVDRQIISTDIGKLNLAVGIIHRGPTNAPPRPAAGGGAPAAPTAQAEPYIITSGGGTLVTGGHIVNGRKSAPDSQVTRVLNGPSCSGRIEGPDVVKRVVKRGDIIIIPAGVPHGWTDIADHVDYLSVRPDPDRVLPRDYVHPALKQ